ncbi:MAG TPA: thrombospondin type 3 repeat-containing protein, partial [Candidatus Binatia bacterium]
MNINKLVLFSAAFMLAWLLGSMPAGAAVNPACDPILFPTGDCDNDGILNNVDTCDNLDPAADCDGDGVLNGVDACPATVLGSTFGFGAVTCDISGLDGPVLSSGCSLAE